MPDALQPILPHIPAFLLVMFRLGGLFIFAPIFGSPVVPVRVRVFLALLLAFCVYPLVPAQVPIELGLWTMSLAVAAEIFIGMAIGYGASLPLVGMQVGGVMIGHQLGLGLARVFNPDSNEETEVLSQLMFFMALAVFLLLDGHHVLVASVARSFGNIPLGAYTPDGQVLDVLLGLLTSMLELAVRVSAPLLCLIFLETVALGFIARTVPQINILSLGFPLRIILGVFLLVAMVGPMYGQLRDFVTQMLETVFRMFAF